MINWGQAPVPTLPTVPPIRNFDDTWRALDSFAAILRQGQSDIKDLQYDISMNYVIDGLYSTISGGGNPLMTLPAGTAFINGKLWHIDATQHRYTNNRATMVNLLPDGSLQYLEKDFYFNQSALPPVEGAIHLQLVTVTDGVVTGCIDLRPLQPSIKEEPEAFFDWFKLLTELEIPTGPLAGAYIYSPRNRVIWYFSNIGLYFFTRKLPAKVKTYLDLYISLSDLTTWFIYDYEASDPVNHPYTLDVQRRPDSTDSYAATFIKLAAKYVRDNSDWTWWNANKLALKNIAYNNLLLQVKPNNLVKTYQSGYSDPGGVPFTYDVSYTEDNCEVYGGLNAFTEVLEITGDSDAAYYRTFTNLVASGIHALYDIPTNTWRWNDTPDGTVQATGPSWYPAVVTQFFPHLHDVPGLGEGGIRNYASDADKYKFGWEYMLTNAPHFWERPYDGFPWLMLAYYIALRIKDPHKANAMLRLAKARHLNIGASQKGTFTVMEVGYAVGIQDLLVGGGTHADELDIHVPRGGTNGQVLAQSSLGPIWEDATAGVPGPAGPAGPTGPGGATGAIGATGIDGKTIPGRDGARGVMGLPGPAGPQGATGGAGAAGATGPKGAEIPGRDGKPGAWGFPGPQGAQGPQGLAGAAGPQGPAVGLLVHEGKEGRWGFPGPPGAAGAVGAQGIQGTQGIQGISGPYLPGPPGPAGRDSWLPGPAGAPGAAGAQGAQGPAGVSGLALGMLLREAQPGPWGFPGPPAPNLYGSTWAPIIARLAADNAAIAAATPTTGVAVVGLQQAVGLNEEWDVEWVLHLANSVATDVFVFNVVSSAGTFTGRVTIQGANGVPTTGAAVAKRLMGPTGTITVASANAPGNTGTVGLITTVNVRAQGKQTVAAGLLTVQVRAGSSAAASSGTVVVKSTSLMFSNRMA